MQEHMQFYVNFPKLRDYEMSEALLLDFISIAFKEFFNPFGVPLKWQNTVPLKNVKK